MEPHFGDPHVAELADPEAGATQDRHDRAAADIVARALDAQPLDVPADRRLRLPELLGDLRGPLPFQLVGAEIADEQGGTAGF